MKNYQKKIFIKHHYIINDHYKNTIILSIILSNNIFQNIINNKKKELETDLKYKKNHIDDDKKCDL